MMTFIQDTDTNIIMDLNEIGDCPPIPNWPPMEQHALKVDDLRRFHAAGATVALEFLPWSKVNPADDVWDWGYADEMIDRCLNAGMRVLFMGPTDAPQWCPDDWYIRMNDGTILKQPDERNRMHTWGMLSPWNIEARACQLEFIKRMTGRYNSDDVLCVYGNASCGEAMLPEANGTRLPGALYDRCAIDSFRALVHNDDVIPNAFDFETQYWMHASLREWLIEQQKIYLTHPSRELLMSLSPYYGYFVPSGNTTISGYIDAIVRELKPAQMHYISFTYFQPLYEVPYDQWFRMMSKAYGVKFIVGGEWCDGAVENAPKARDQGLKLLTAPIHPFLHQNTVTDLMVEQVAQSHAIMSGEAVMA